MSDHGDGAELPPPDEPVRARPTTGAEDPDERWRSRPWVARTIRFLILAIPIGIAFLIAYVLSGLWDTPDGFVAQVVRFLCIAGVSTVVLYALQLAARRLLPLAALYSLSLIFPDEAPSRFGIALRTKTPRQLEQALADAGEHGLGDTPAEAAEELLGLVAALSKHDRMTRGHSERVRAYSRMIGEEMKLPDDQLDRLHWAGLVHDVGKMYVPGSILNKPGKLTDDEFEVIKTHTTHGKVLVAGLEPWLGDAANAVWEHHERYGGGGYPTGVSSAELTLESRIVCVADAFDVMTSARSYKRPLAATKARAELERCQGTQFDPVVVRAMMTISLGRLWAAMGPLSLIAQVRLFPRRLTQGGNTVTGALAASIAIVLTALAGSAASESSGNEVAAEPPPATAPPTTDPGDEPSSSAPAAEPAPPEPAVVTEPPPETQPPVVTDPPPTAPPPTTDPPPAVAPAAATPTPASPTPNPPAPPPPPAPAATSPPPPPTTASSTTVPPTVPPSPALLTIASSSAGDVSSSAALPLVARAPINQSLENYDDDRDSDPGLTITRSAAGLDSTDPAGVQRWIVPPEVVELATPIRLQMWFAPAETSGSGFLVVAAGLYDCAADGSGCIALAQDVAVFPAVADVFNGVSFDLSPALGTHEILSGRTVELRLAVPAESSTDAVLAYDSVDFPSSITFGG